MRREEGGKLSGDFVSLLAWKDSDYQQQGSGKGLIIYHVVSINNYRASEQGSAFCNGST